MAKGEQLPAAGDQGNDSVVDEATEKLLRDSVVKTGITEVGVPKARPAPDGFKPIDEPNHR